MIQQKLLNRQAAGHPIRVGWVGAGRMITGAICQTALMKGMANSVICDIRVDAAVRAYELNGFKREDVVIADTASAANDAIRAGKPVVTQDSHIMPQLELDCVVEGTGVPEVGAEVAFRCIQGGPATPSPSTPPITWSPTRSHSPSCGRSRITSRPSSRGTACWRSASARRKPTFRPALCWTEAAVTRFTR
ncbi:MAG: hypothetical protein WCI75_04545 [candidate division NC10 bacterium]